MALSGKEYADLVASYILKNFGARGLTVYREVSMGKTIIGKNRHVDILVLREATSTVLAIECKYQDTLGTVDEKIPYAIQDMQAMGVPVCLAYAGGGFSSGILHMLAACPIAAQCLPSPSLEPSRETREVDIAVAMAFGFWDLVVGHKKPFALPAPSAVAAAVVAAQSVPSVAAAAPSVVAPPVAVPVGAVVAPVAVTPTPSPVAESFTEALNAGPLFAAAREPASTG